MGGGGGTSFNLYSASGSQWCYSGNGGGIIMVSATQIRVESQGFFSAEGQAGASTIEQSMMGGFGSGAGGSVYLATSRFTGTDAIKVGGGVHYTNGSPGRQRVVVLPPTDQIQFEPVYEGIEGGVRYPGLYGGGSSFAHPAMADLDSDGDIDVLVGEADGTITYWENVGTAQTPEWSAPVRNYSGISVGEFAAPAAGDVDGDGDLDLVLGCGDGTLSFYRNIGDRREPVFVKAQDSWAGIALTNYSTPALGDLNGDGKMDVVCGELVGGGLVYRENLGANTWGPLVENFAEVFVTGNTAPVLADFDGDGDLDLLVGGADGTLSFAENTGTRQAPAWDKGQEDNWQQITVNDWAAPAAGDLNGDGQLDMLVGDYLGGVSGFMRRAGSYQATGNSFHFIDVGDRSAPALGDLDGDGDLDMLVGERNGTLTYYENRGSFRAPHWAPPVTKYAGIDVGTYAAPCLYDLDGDGRLDLLVGKQTRTISHYRNLGTLQVPDFRLQTAKLGNLTLGYYATPCIVDGDGDGDGDLVVGQEDGAVVWCENTGTRTAPAWGTPVAYTGLDVGDYSRPVAAAFSPAGRSDLLIGAGDGTLYLFEHSATNTYPLWDKPKALREAIDVGANAAPVLGDMDGDGDPDLLVGNAAGGVQFWRNTTPCLSIAPRAATVFAGQLFTLEALGVEATATLAWSLARNDSGGTVSVMSPTTAIYAAGASGGRGNFDVIEVTDAGSTESRRAGRAFVNVLAPADIGAFGKAVICAGWKHSGDSVWPATSNLAKLAYGSLMARGFRAEDVYVLSPDTSLDADGDGVSDVSAESTLPNFRNALQSWAAGTDELTLYLVDHGERSGGREGFRLNAGDADFLTPGELAGLLNGLQAGGSMRQKVVIDSCYSGVFLPALRAPAGNERLVATACADSQLTYFLAEGLVSFSECFWSSVLCDAPMGRAFTTARDAMERYQAAKLDANGDGGYDPVADLAPDGPAATAAIGAPHSLGAERPQIGRVVSNQTLGSGSTTATLWAADISGGYPIARVWAVIVPPDFQTTATAVDPIIDMPRVEFVRNAAEDRWEAPYGGFTKFGSYKVIVYAADTWNAVSLPKQVYIHKTDRTERAIVVAGALSFNTSTPLESTRFVCDTAYRALLNRGFGQDTIRYLSSQTGDYQPCTLASLQDAIVNWAGNATQVTLFITGRGSENQVRISDTQTLTAAQLKQWVDQFQTAHPGRLVIVLDFEAAGSFADELAPPPTGRERVVVFGTKPGRRAYCLGGGAVSFGQLFFSAVYNGENVMRAMSGARDAMRFWTGYGVTGQEPGIDDNGDGEVSGADGQVAWNTFIGAAFLTGGDDLPEIGSVTTPTVVAKGDTAILRATGVRDSDGVASVQATIVPLPPLDPNAAATVSLVAQGTGGTWEAPKVFETVGTYSVCFVAADFLGNSSGVTATTFTVRFAESPPDAYEPDDAMVSATEYILSDAPSYDTTQVHNFHRLADEDWVNFEGYAGHAYTLRVENPQPNCNAVVDLYDGADPGTPVIEGVNNGPGQPLNIPWGCPATGTYFWRVYNFDPSVCGAQTSYTVHLTEDSGANNGLASAITPNAVDCSWDGGLAPTDAGFVLYRSLSPESGWRKVNPNPIKDNSYRDTGLAPSTLYFYLVRIVHEPEGKGPLWTGVFCAATPLPVAVSGWAVE